MAEVDQKEAEVVEKEEENVDADGFLVPEEGSLARILEADTFVRRRLLVGTDEDAAKRHITQWPNANSVGVKSMKALALNAHVLELLAKWWTSHYVHHPVAMTIDVMRREASADSCCKSHGG